MMKEVISHVKKNVDGSWEKQCNDDHQQGVAQRAAAFAAPFGMAEWGRVLGLLHDKGKERHTFQQHIIKESGLVPAMKVEGDYRHAYVGSLVARQLFPNTHLLIDNALAGHHRGLYDDDELRVLMKETVPPDVTITPISTSLMLPRLEKPSDLHHLIRMLYSCLVDADYLDTEAFMMPEQSKARGGKYSMKELLSILENYLSKLKRDSPDTEVNRIRNYVQEQCREKSGGALDFYSLTVPTGGGKTLSSVLWALRHAVGNNLQRIIIAIPYTSIITQTASVLRGIFGAENVLEHHSNINYDGTSDKELAQRQMLASENWDYPVVVTTNVQLFESLFSNRPSDCRKLHNIAKSVLILDEVQMLPTGFLQPIVDTLDTLKRIFGTSVLFTTASQPVLTGKIEGTNFRAAFQALPSLHEIIPAEARLHDKLRRTTIEFDETPQHYDDVARSLSQHQRVLCIVNTRRDAKEIFERLPKDGITLHLSRMMCPRHVRETLEELKTALAADGDTVIRVVATQLIEAGVDIDFPVVFRQEAGLDSVLQAAGRCNREGKRMTATTYVFSLQGEHPLPRGFITQTNNARLGMGQNHDWLAPEAMTAYFNQLYSRINDFDKPKVKDLLYTSSMQFETAARAFRLIDDTTTSVVVNWKDSMNLIDRLKQQGVNYTLMKQLSQYSVNIRDNDMKLLREAGALEEIIEGVYVISDSAYYKNDVGLVTTNHWMEETYII